jgi:hypothetical protein
MDDTRSIARRFRQVRVLLYGDWGHEGLAADLGVPAQTWLNCEAGVAVRWDVLLRFLALTGADPCWLLTGEGEPWRAGTGRAGHVNLSTSN